MADEQPALPPVASNEEWQEALDALRVQEKALTRQLDAYPAASGFLLDTVVGGASGGTGQPFDWSVWPRTVDRPLVLAGGLDADNVGDAIRATRPYAVDVSSGVEQEKGIKDAAKVAAFIDEVNKSS